MLSGRLWPVHFKPLPDELLSCWIVRIAHGHGLKAQTFCNQIFGNQQQVWNRDIDRLAPRWLIDEMSLRTGTRLTVVLNTTLRAYEGFLYRKFRLSGALQWILALKMYHRKREGHGLQFCSACLAEDAIPYFRKHWRVAYNTVCARHHKMLRDRCPNCGVAIAVHRLDVGKADVVKISLLSYCHECGFDLRNASQIEPLSYDNRASALLHDVAKLLDTNTLSGCAQWDLGRYEVMHQLCRIMTSRYEHVILREFILSQVGFRDIPLIGGHISFEMRSIEERHHLIQLAAWLLVDPEARIPEAWRAGAVRYNVFLKDFVERPEWYAQIVGQLTDWRNRFE